MAPAIRIVRTLPARVLITGAGGFVGRYLLPALRAAFPHAVLIGASHRGMVLGTDESLVLDLDETAGIADAIAKARPDAVLHLAAQSDVGASFRDPLATWRTNVIGTVALGEAVLRTAPTATFLLASSGEVYGLGFQAGLPLSEDAPFAPANPYAGSKAAADLALGEMALRGLRPVRLRPFTQIGPGQSKNFVVAAFAHQVARIEAGLQEPVVRTGALNRWRDILDVRDVCAAYVAALSAADRLAPGAAVNICSGVPRRVGDTWTCCWPWLALPRGSNRKRRGCDRPMWSGCKATRPAPPASLGGLPQISWEDTLRSVLDDWRERVAAGE